MTKAPEEVWAWPIDNPAFCTSHEEPMNRDARHYTRTDTIPALLAAEREKALREAAAMVATSTTTNYHMSNSILALIDAETDPQPALPRTSEPQAAPEVTMQQAAKIRSDAINEFAENAKMTGSEHVKALPEDVLQFRRDSAFAALIAQEDET